MFGRNRCYDMNYMNNTSFSFESNAQMNEFPEAMPNMMNGGCPHMQPIYECPQERVCHREIVHEVPHVCPINTRIVNHHIYRHTYTPCYTCSEENVCSNVYEGSCCSF